MKNRVSVAESHPHLLDEWSDESLRPEDVSAGSNKQVTWCCKACKNVWKTRVYHRTTSGSGCPSCGLQKTIEKRQKKLWASTSLALSHPDLCQEWSEENACKPTEITAGSNRKVKWTCRTCCNRWIASPNTRIGHLKTAQDQERRGCPYCSGRNPKAGEALPDTHPELCKEWIDVEVSPADVSRGSGKKVMWKCGECKHQWASTILNRTQGKGCPKCAKTLPSRACRSIARHLKKLGVSFIQEQRFQDCRAVRPLPFDFALFFDGTLVGLIEYQGEHHYRPVYGNKKFERTLRNDAIKRTYCQQKQIPILELPFQNATSLKSTLTEFLVEIGLAEKGSLS